MQNTPPPRQEIGGVWDSIPVQPIPYQQGGMPMGLPATSATTALVLSIGGLMGLFCFAPCGLLAIPGLILSNSSLEITKQIPGHPDAGTAKAAQIIGAIVSALLVLGIGILAAMLGLDIMGVYDW